MLINSIPDQLVRVGMDPVEAGIKTKLFQQAYDRLAELGTADQCVAWYAPGRIEFLGKHTDYAGGRSLLCAVERGICLVASPRTDKVVRIAPQDGKPIAEFAISPDLPAEPGHWSDYPRTVARRIAQNFSGTLRGADIALASDLPIASGMSSSSALVVAVFSALSEINRLDLREEYRNNIHRLENLAGYLGTVENGQNFGSLRGDKGVGTFGGSEDHTAILCCQPGHLSQYAFCPVRFERVIALPGDCILVIGSSGVIARKGGEARDLYNRVSLRARAALELWRNATGRQDQSLAAAVKSSEGAMDHLREILRDSKHSVFSPRSLLHRIEQFNLESNHIIPQAADVLSQSRINDLGALVDQSQRGAEKYLENQIPQTICLAAEARKLGALAASAFGAGFGGSVWAMVKVEQAGDFSREWAARYRLQFPADAQRSEFFTTRAGPAAMRVETVIVGDE